VADGPALTAVGGGAILSELVSKQARIPAEGTDLDQIRSLRERLLTSVPAGATLVVMDLVIRDRPSDVAVNLALAMAEAGDPIRLVLPDHDTSHVSMLEAALDLEELESATGLTVFRSRWAPELEVVFTRDDHELGAPGARFGDVLTLDDEVLTTTLVSMPPTAPRSLWLTAGRLGHSIILVAARRETRTAAVRRLGSELEAVGAVVHGSVLVPRRRSVNLSRVKRTRGPSGSSTRVVAQEPAPAYQSQSSLGERESPDPTYAPRRTTTDAPLNFGEQTRGELSGGDAGDGGADVSAPSARG
jgi:Mrp family chromosome partitioning ATPase